MNAIKTWWKQLVLDIDVNFFNGLEFGIRHISGKDLDEHVDLGDDLKHQFGVLVTIACMSVFVVFITDPNAE